MDLPIAPRSRLIVVSNRGPYVLHTTRDRLKLEKTVGGLVTSLLPMLEKFGGVWIAAGDPPGRYRGSEANPEFQLLYIPLSVEQRNKYYYGFSNSAIWPLSHYFLGRVRYDESEWNSYEEVNQYFAQIITEELHADDIVWVHDYQLARVPYYLRRERSQARIAFFWHIPFPSAEVFRTLPWRKPFLEGLLASDLIGFHIREYAENFIESAVEVLGASRIENGVLFGGHVTRVLARPIGIDYKAVAQQARSRRTEKRVQKLKENLKGQAIILGVERMDYTKGILERLQAMERFLAAAPALHGKVTLIQIVTPSRNQVAAYQQRKREIDEIVGRINGRFSDGLWFPIRYLYRSVTPAELIAYYCAADIALVTPLRDGLNLVAKEYVASRIHTDGVLILSEFAGVTHQLPEALQVNPYSTEDMAATIQIALEMPCAEQKRRMGAMQDRISVENIEWWANEFTGQMASIPAIAI